MSRSFFHGRLRINNFVKTGTGMRDPTPGLPVMLAMVANTRHMDPGELVYDQSEVATHVCL
eukprot:7357877-Heterocapsa_arctica.AAC.1